MKKSNPILDDIRSAFREFNKLNFKHKTIIVGIFIGLGGIIGIYIGAS